MTDIDELVRAELGAIEPRPGGLEATLARATRRQTRRRVARAATGVAILAIAGVAIVAGSLNSPSSSAAVEVSLPGRLIDAAPSGRALWAATQSRAGGDLVRIAARSAEIKSRISTPAPQAMALGDGSIWEISFRDSTATRIDPTSGDVIATIKLALPTPIAGDSGFFPFDIAVGEGAVWVSTGRGYVARIDPSTNRVSDYIKVPDESTGEIVAGSGAVWVGESGAGVAKIDPETDQVTSITGIDGPNGERLGVGGLALQDGNLWVTGTWAAPYTDQQGNSGYRETGRNAVVEVDPQTAHAQRAITVPKSVGVSAATPRVLWLQANSKQAYRLDTASGRVSAPITLKEPGSVVAAIGRNLWIARPHAILVRQTVG